MTVNFLSGWEQTTDGLYAIKLCRREHGKLKSSLHPAQRVPLVVLINNQVTHFVPRHEDIRIWKEPSNQPPELVPCGEDFEYKIGVQICAPSPGIYLIKLCELENLLDLKLRSEFFRKEHVITIVRIPKFSFIRYGEMTVSSLTIDSYKCIRTTNLKTINSTSCIPVEVITRWG
jgi:hypothetical protein